MAQMIVQKHKGNQKSWKRIKELGISQKGRIERDPLGRDLH